MQINWLSIYSANTQYWLRLTLVPRLVQYQYEPVPWALTGVLDTSCTWLDIAFVNAINSTLTAAQSYSPLVSLTLLPCLPLPHAPFTQFFSSPTPYHDYHRSLRHHSLIFLTPLASLTLCSLSPILPSTPSHCSNPLPFLLSLTPWPTLTTSTPLPHHS